MVKSHELHALIIIDTRLMSEMENPTNNNDSEDAWDDSRVKRRRLDYDPHVPDKDDFNTPPFLPFHLKVLKALEEKEHSIVNSESQQQRENVPVHIWAMISAYISHRNKLFESKQQAIHSKKLTQEATQFGEKIGNVTHSESTPNKTRPSPSMVYYSSPSAHQQNKTGNAFQVVVRLLELRSISAQRVAEQCTKPLLPLLQFCENRIAVLETSLQDQKQQDQELEQQTIERILSASNHRDNLSQINDATKQRQDEIVTVKALLHLWSRLMKDVRNAMNCKE